MNGNQIIICDLDHEDVKEEREVFDAEGYSFLWLRCRTQAEVAEKCQGAVVLLNQYIRMDRAVFEALPSVKCVVRYGVGYDNVNLADAREFGVQVCNVPDYGTMEVADQALAHMMNLVRKTAFSDRLIRSGVWDYRKLIPIHRLSESTVGICGVGRIGNAFAHRVHAFGCKVIAYDVEQNNGRRHFPDFVEFVPFAELLERSDILSIHCPLNETTYHMFSAAELDRMKPGAYLINVARGGIVDEDALYDALKEGRIAGAALDVVEREPLEASSRLLDAGCFYATPHAAWYSEESSRELKRKAAQEAVRFLKGIPVRYSVL